MWLAGMIPSEFYLSVFTTWTMVDIMGIVVLVPILESIIVRKLNSEFSDRNEEIETMTFLALSALLMYIAITSYGQFASLVAACALVPVLTIYSVRHREFVVTTAAFFLGAYTLAIITLFTPSELADVSLYIHSVQVGLFAIISAMLLIASSVNNINGLNEKVNQQRSRFLANMSHEIRTPMTGVLGLTDMVLKTELSQKQEELIKNIQSSGEMLRQVINDILDQSKLQAGKMEVNEVAFELSSVAETTVSMFGPMAEKQGTILSFDIEAKLPKFVVGDPIRIRQILFNLTSNAIKFTQNGAVEISIERKNEFVRFEVSDTGIGIDENNQKTLFQPFEQLNQDLNREHGGTGLGLSICKSMVEVMGGEIGADNNPGEGSTFWFTLNLPATNNGVGNPSTEQQTTSNSGENLRILIAEDNPINQMILESLLEDEGHFCTTTDNGEEALEAFNASDFDLILTDIRMPKMDGVELLKQIRNSARPTRDTPMIAITADVSEDNAAIYRDAGFNALAYKPVDPIGLLAQIRKRHVEGVASHLDIDSSFPQLNSTFN